MIENSIILEIEKLLDNKKINNSKLLSDFILLILIV